MFTFLRICVVRLTPEKVRSLTTSILQFWPGMPLALNLLRTFTVASYEEPRKHCPWIRNPYKNVWLGAPLRGFTLALAPRARRFSLAVAYTQEQVLRRELLVAQLKLKHSHGRSSTAL